MLRSPTVFRTRMSALAAAALCAAGGLGVSCAEYVNHRGASGMTAAASVAQPSGGTPRAEPAPLFKGLGSHTRKVSTASAEAQRYFDQALTWTFSFNHDEAIRSYQHAAELDPDLAIAY